MTGIFSWNVHMGGCAVYDPDTADVPRKEPIRAVLAAQRQRGARAAVVVDAYRWDELHGGPQGIAAYTGYPAAHFTRLGDRSLGQSGAGIGIALATDLPHAGPRVLDLGTRRALGTVLDTGRYGLQLIGVYLHHEDEDIRLRQARALCAEAEPDVPTLLVGDFNALRPKLRLWERGKLGVTPRMPVRDMMPLRYQTTEWLACMAARALPAAHPLALAVLGMDRREVVPYIINQGYHDADQRRQRPTVRLKNLPLLGVDYGFHNSLMTVHHTMVVRGRTVRRASDHDGLYMMVEM